MLNLSAVLFGANDLRLEKRNVPNPNGSEVLVKMDSVGICGSDVHFWKYGGNAYARVETPMILGHEGAGRVERCGPDVQNLKIGDRVAIEPGRSCGTCNLCKKGSYNLCRKMKFCSAPPVDGMLANYYCHPEDLCFKLPDSMTLEEGAMIEPLSVAIHACNRGQVSVGSNVFITGAGSIGLLTYLTAKAMGANKVVIADINEQRLAVAHDLGVSSTLKVNSCANPSTLAEQVFHCFEGNHPDVTIECSGAESSICLGISATSPGGVLVLVGMPNGKVTIPLITACVREVDIRGVRRYANAYPVAIEMVAKKLIDPKPLITHRFHLPNALEAFETTESRTDGAIKVLIKCNP